MSELYDIPVTTIDGDETTMADWAGHVLLIVNVASECGYTQQYEGLQRIFDDFAMRGFFVLGVPCNQFGGQEPGSAQQIKQFTAEEFGVNFPLLAKAEVNGSGAHPLFQYLKEHTDGADVQWNFEKFLVDDSGQVIGRFAADVDPEDDSIVDAIEAHLPI